jgi:hypothetical protein
MDFPKLQDDQHAVITVEVSTGIVLCHDGQRFIGSGETWRVFGSLAAARQFAVAEVAAHPSFGCVIYKAQNQQIQTVRNEEHVAALMDVNRAKPKSQL